MATDLTEKPEKQATGRDDRIKCLKRDCYFRRIKVYYRKQKIFPTIFKIITSVVIFFAKAGEEKIGRDDTE